ncbi:MAG: hypothetical protein PHZ11_01160 [Desulfitobacteriaceae bacterium]|nr:hypothetical protein [Desulfitobacteriaceae bacterium]MDD4400647.1 hypothetical protein [Desulfitobacteriaceae bacterium]
MNSGALYPTPVLRRPEYITKNVSSRLFNHSYPLKSTLMSGSQANYSYANRYSLPQPLIRQQLRPLVLQSPANPYFLQPNPYPVYNLPAQINYTPSVSSKGLEIILVAILILVALDLIIVRPLK